METRSSERRLAHFLSQNSPTNLCEEARKENTVHRQSYPCAYYLEKLRKREPFSLSRWGEAEWNSVLRLRPEQAVNCDGHRFFRTMGGQLARALKDLPAYYVAMQPLALRLMGGRIEQWFAENSIDLPWHDADVFHEASKRGEIDKIFEALRETDNLIVVGPEHLRQLSRYVPYREFVLIPDRNCFLCLDEVQDRILRACVKVRKPAVISISAGMPANLMVHNLFPKIGQQSFLIDFGSLWDPYCGVHSRMVSAHKNHP